MEILPVREFLDLLERNRLQPIPQIAEVVILDVTIIPTASYGARELRLLTREGLTNSMTFQVGRLPEVLEREPNDPDWAPTPQVFVGSLPAIAFEIVAR